MRGGTGTGTTQQHQHLQYLTKGSTVEVTSDEEGFKGVWFEATILGVTLPASKKKLVLVEYRSILADENGSEPLREFVHISFVRPVPPAEKVESLELYDVVDASYKDGWWTGVITRLRDESRYQVTFNNPPDELEFGVSELRLHKQWVKGKWVRPGKQRTGSLMFSIGKEVEVSFDRDDLRDAWFPATVLEHCENGSFLVESYRTKSDKKAAIEKVTVDSFHIRPSPPIIKKKKFNLLEKVDALYDFAWWSGVITRELADSRYIVFFKHKNKEKELNDSDLRPHMDWKDGQWFTTSQRKRLQELGEEKGGTLEKSRGLKSSTRGNKGIAIENAVDVTQKLSARKEIDVPVIIGLECTKVMSSKGKRSHQINNESLEPIRHQKWIDAAIDGIQETKHLGDGEGISQKRKRGRPPKKLRGRPSKKLGRPPKKLRGRPPKKLASTATDMEPSGHHSKDESLGPVELAIIVNEDGKEQLEVQMGHSRKRGRMRKITQTKMSNEKAVQSRQAKSSNIESQAQGSVDSSGVKTVESYRIATDVGEVLTEIPCSRFDDQPLAKWFEEIQSPTSVDGSRVSPAHSPKQCAEVREKPDLPMQTPVNGTPATQTETQSLPFVKNTLLWSTIESMDIFRRIPQKPHFNPLEHCKEGSREGLAIGYMVTFLSIAERTSRLHYDDPRSTIEEILETLSDLETHGFDVQLVRDRLTELLLMKDKQEKLETQVADIDNQIITHNMDKEHIDGEIEEINKQIAELQDKLSLATSRKVVKNLEIDGLRSKLMDIQAGTKKAHNEFDSLVSKPL